MSWNSTLGLWLVGGFLIYVISAGRLSAYLAIFNSTAPSYTGPLAATSPGAYNIPIPGIGNVGILPGLGRFGTLFQ